MQVTKPILFTYLVCGSVFFVSVPYSDLVLGLNGRDYRSLTEEEAAIVENLDTYETVPTPANLDAYCCLVCLDLDGGEE